MGGVCLHHVGLSQFDRERVKEVSPQVRHRVGLSVASDLLAYLAVRPIELSVPSSLMFHRAERFIDPIAMHWIPRCDDMAEQIL